MRFLDSKITIVGIVAASILLLAMIPISQQRTTFHTRADWERYMEEGFFFPPPQDTSILFPTASRCSGCHGFDPQGNASVDWQGNDINIVDDWSTSMMANSAKDPFWRAKVSHEVLANPAHKMELETKCTSCHAPNGHHTALLRGASHYSIEEMKGDSVALDGVSCASCHMKSADNLEHLFSGEANFDTSGVMFGPFEQPFAAPMTDFVGFEPVFSEHINSSGICASCHTLLTNSVDLDGIPTGNKFVEQATYHEWINSAYDDDGESPQSCQSCHMPITEDKVVISANYLFLDPRSPFAIHDMIGANTTMIELIKNNKEDLNINAADEHFDETIAKTLEMLQTRSVNTELSNVGNSNDSIFFEYKITNNAGHKFPSGYPSRRVFVEFVLTAENGDTIFQSGVVQPDYTIKGHENGTEEHYDIISSEDEVQVYELVLGDVNGDFTTLLERSHIALKDNRLPPLGFSKEHLVYDTTRIYGKALTDDNFNRSNGEEGSGSDIIKYRISNNGYSGLAKVTCKVYYQALPPRWMAPMFEESTIEIDSFRTMYNNADLSPVLVAADTLENIMIAPTSSYDRDIANITIYPNPSIDGMIQIRSDRQISSIDLYNLEGQLLMRSGNTKRLLLPQNEGVYLIQISTDKGIVTKRVVRVNR